MPEFNRSLPNNLKLARFMERWVSIPINALEWLGAYLIVLPLNASLRRLDGLSLAFEGTWLRALLAHALFPVTLIASMWIGFEVLARGASIQSIATLALIPVVYGLFAAPLERLMPFSRDWLEAATT